MGGSPRRKPRLVPARLVGVAAAVTLLAAGLVIGFAASLGAERVAGNAQSLHWTNSVLGSAALTRAAVGQAVFFVVDRELGVASAPAAAGAVDEADSARRRLAALVDGWPDASPEGAAAAVAYLEGVDRVMDALDVGDASGALSLVNGPVEGTYVGLRSSLAAERDAVLEQIASTDHAAGWVRSAIEVLVTLLIPAVAVGLYWRHVRRQVAERQIEMEARLEAERAFARAKDEFIAGLSHELRTPLTSIYGFSEVLLDQELIDPLSSMELVELINVEAGELSRMVEDLLVAARIEAGALSVTSEPFDVVSSVKKVVSPFARRGHQIAVDCADALVLGDHLRARQVVRNLVSNAIRHGGDRIAVRGAVVNGRYALAVVDDGPGVPEDIRNRLFERFVHTGRAPLTAGSVGLGLAISKALSEQMGGSLEYRRIENQTMFSLTLGLARDSSAMSSPSGALTA